MAQKPSVYEKKWAFLHPIAAIKVKLITKKCYRIYDSVLATRQLDTYSNGGKSDAFRHVFFMAAFSQKIKIKKLRKLGLAHEKSNYKQFINGSLEFGELPDSMATVMDLYNNELGFEMGSNLKNTDLITLSKLVINSLNDGLAVIAKRNKLGKYVDCNGNELEMPKQKKWNIGKCLVKSNEN